MANSSGDSRESRLPGPRLDPVSYFLISSRTSRTGDSPGASSRTVGTAESRAGRPCIIAVGMGAEIRLTSLASISSSASRSRRRSEPTMASISDRVSSPSLSRSS